MFSKRTIVIIIGVLIFLFILDRMFDTPNTQNFFRTVRLNGMLVNDQGLEVMDMTLGYQAPSGDYFFDANTGALTYSDGFSAPVFLGVLPSSAPASSSFTPGGWGNTVEDETARIMAIINSRK